MTSLRSTDRRILGHEGIGVITEVGCGVSNLSVGDRVILSCISSCGSCSYCHQGSLRTARAEGTEGIGWIFGHLIDGTQAEYVRVPFAESSSTPARRCAGRGGIVLSDILPTGFEIGVRTAG